MLENWGGKNDEEKAGIVPWDNLVVTYGDRKANVDMRIVESEIMNKLI